MIPSYIPKVGTIAKFWNNPRPYTVKHVVEDTIQTVDGYEGTGDGWLLLVDKQGYEYAVRFSQLAPKEDNSGTLQYNAPKTNNEE